MGERVAYLGKGKSQREGGSFSDCSLATLRLQLDEVNQYKRRWRAAPTAMGQKLTAIIVQTASGETKPSTIDSTDK